MKICDWCSEEFQPNVTYQIYCSPNCRKLATKQKVNERYLLKKRQRMRRTKNRCSGGCDTILSVYNETGFCSQCMVNNKKVNQALKELKGLFEYERFEE